MSTSHKIVSTGGMIPLFELVSANREAAIGPWDYKQKSNLALFFFHGADCKRCQRLLLDLSDHYSHYCALDAEILTISADRIENLQRFAQQNPVAFPILWDEGGIVSRKYIEQGQKTTEAAQLQVGIFVADRFCELYMKATASESDELPSEIEIRDWLQFIDIQCPECIGD